MSPMPDSSTRGPRPGSLPLGFSIPRSGWLGAAPDHGEDGRAVLGGDGVDTAVRAVVHVAGGHGTGLVGVGALDHEDQLVAHVTMAGERSARLEAREDSAPPRAGRILPDLL